MGTLSSVFCIYCSLCSHTAWQKAIFIENCCFWKWIKLKNNLQPWPYIRTCRTSCHPGLMYSPALILFRGNVPPWPYILARPSIWHVRVCYVSCGIGFALSHRCALSWLHVQNAHQGQPMGQKMGTHTWRGQCNSAGNQVYLDRLGLQMPWNHFQMPP